MINQHSKSYPLPLKKIWCLSMTPYYDAYTQRYTNIVTLDKEPIGPLSHIVRKIYPPRLSDFQRSGYGYNIMNNSHSHCLYAIQNIDNINHVSGNKMNLLTIDCISELYSFLISNNYEIDFKLTKLMLNPDLKNNNPSRPLTTICYISYLYSE
jgi:hypothetical protein